MEPGAVQVGDVFSRGVDESEGTDKFSGDGGTQPYTIPMTIDTKDIGSVTNGEQITVTVEDVVTGTEAVILTTTKTLTCNLDANGNGTCS